MAPVKLPSLPPPEFSCLNGCPKSLASVSAIATSFIVAGDASQTGLVNPNVTFVDTSAAGSFSANIFSIPASRSACFFAIDNTSAVASDETQFTHWPALVTPTENVQSSKLMDSIAIMVSAIFLIAERPSDKRSPAWLGRPKVLTR